MAAVFSKHIFLFLGTLSIFTLCQTDAMATACRDKTVYPGKFCHAGGIESECRAGCYCTGAIKVEGVNNSEVDKACKNKWSTPEANLKRVGVHYCPEAFPESAGGAKSKEKCYNADTGLYYKKYSCGAGKYLVANSGDCADCPTDSEDAVCLGGGWIPADHDQGISTCPSGLEPSSDRKKCGVNCEPGYYLPANASSCSVCPSNPTLRYCPGGWFEKKADDQGLNLCNEGQRPNEDRSACNDPVHCNAGTYLPKNSETCAECPDGFICPYDDDYTPDAQDQGKYLPRDICGDNQVVNYYRTDCEDCPTGTVANDSRTNCDDTTISVPAGEYLPANSVVSDTCSGSTTFCPGGEFWKEPFEQGRYTCPLNGVATNDNTSCSLTLTGEQMANGISGNGTCWMKTNPSDFKYCVYGVRLVDVGFYE